MNEEIIEKMKAAVRKVVDDEINELSPPPSVVEQFDRMNAFIQQPKLQVGDRVIRTSEGEKMYKMPKDEDMVCLVVEVFNIPIVTEDNDFVNGLVAVTKPSQMGNYICTLPVDLRYYQKM